MVTKFEPGTKVNHKIFGAATVQPTIKKFHPNIDDELIYIELDDPPENCMKVVQVDADACTEIK